MWEVYKRYWTRLQRINSQCGKLTSQFIYGIYLDMLYMYIAGFPLKVEIAPPFLSPNSFDVVNANVWSGLTTMVQFPIIMYITY